MIDLFPVYLEKDALDFHLNREVKSEEIRSLNDVEQTSSSVLKRRINSRETSITER